jgi:hypothetical protein
MKNAKKMIELDGTGREKCREKRCREKRETAPKGAVEND